MTRPDLSILIVNYNTAHLLGELFQTLRAASGSVTTQIVMVDNASKDDSVARIRADYPGVELIVNETNVGFGRANNQCLVKCRGRYLLLLNTDAFVAPDTLDKTLAYMEANPRCGILGVKLVGRDGTLQPSCRYFPSPWNQFLARGGLQCFFPAVPMVDDMAWDHASVRRCDWVPGCYYLMRREVADEVGLFDPRYFLYYEEVDHCRAAKKAGWEVVYYPDTSVIHLGGESAKSDAELTESGRQIDVLQIESELLYFRKNHGFYTMLSALLLSNLADLLRLTKRLLKLRRPFGFSYYLKRIGRSWHILVATGGGRRPTR